MKEKRLEEMRQEYENYAVPKEALERMKSGIAQAKKEEKGMKIYRIGKTAGISAAAAIAAIVLLANSGENIARAMEQVPVLGVITRVVTFRNYSSQSGSFEANVDIPEIDGENSELLGINQTIEEYSQKLIDMYEKDLRASNGEGNYALESTYEVICDDEKYLSIRINSVLTMASGMQFVKIFNVDKESGEILGLAELTGMDSCMELISDNIKAQMKERMAEDEGITYFLEGEDGFSFNSITEETNFYLNENHEIVIVFDEYEVAPGFMGVQEFTIPKEVISVK